MPATIAITYHQDPGHGWLAIPRATVDALGIAASISTYSYESNGIAYLEEDCDAAKLIQAIKAAGLEFKITEQHSNRDSFIRNMPSFDRAITTSTFRAELGPDYNRRTVGGAQHSLF